MTHRPNQPGPTDLDIARTLAALNSAAPPEGMEARIAQRLAAHSPAPVPFHNLRALIPGPSWLRGALTGALVATAACALIFYTTRPHHPAQPQVAANTSHPITGAPVTLKTRDICMGAPSIRDSHGADGWNESASRTRAPHLTPASFAPSNPAPPAPLTAQERVLLQLARTATPAQLAALHRASDNSKQSDAEREAAFQKFFAPPPELLAIDKAQEQAINPDETPLEPTEVQN